MAAGARPGLLAVGRGRLPAPGVRDGQLDHGVVRAGGEGDLDGRCAGWAAGRGVLEGVTRGLARRDHDVAGFPAAEAGR